MASAGLPVDMELKKAFQDHQAMMIDVTQKIKVAEVQKESLKRQEQHAKLTTAELESLPDDVRLYEGVGRMFLLQEKSTILESLRSKIDKSEEKIKNLEANKAYLERSIKESEDNIREMLQQKHVGK
ncbi:prefoldin subunit 1-like [Ptychodera flava]|uniref:prefoldin subunit 1-like n=1 Tax=Ptychodera flava TaxID=63121 RepID=UPI003969DF6A